MVTAFDLLKRHPIVPGVQNHLDHRSQAGIRICNPFEGLPVDGPPNFRAPVQRPGSKGQGRLISSLSQQPHGFQQHGHPSGRFAQKKRFLAAGENFLAQRLALYGLLVYVKHGQGGHVQVAQNVQLIQGALPFTQDCKQLEEESPVAAVVRLFADLLFQVLERLLQFSFTNQLFCAALDPLSMYPRPEQRSTLNQSAYMERIASQYPTLFDRPAAYSFAYCGVYVSLYLAKFNERFSLTVSSPSLPPVVTELTITCFMTIVRYSTGFSPPALLTVSVALS